MDKEAREWLASLQGRVDSLGRGAMSDAETIADVRSRHSMVLETMGRICEGLHKAEDRIAALEATDRIAISGGKECDRRYVDLRERVDVLHDRVDTCELDGKASVVGRVGALEVYRTAENRENGRWHEEFRQRIEALERVTVSPIACDSVEAMDPTCGTCRWYKADTLPVERCGTGRLMTGLCVAHPIHVAKHESDTCGEHSPRD